MKTWVAAAKSASFHSRPFLIFEAKESEVRLVGWSRSRRVVLLRRPLTGTVEPYYLGPAKE